MCRAPARGKAFAGRVTTGDAAHGNSTEVGMGFADKVRNQFQSVKGKGKQRVGGATGNRDMQAEGDVDQAKGDLKKAGENVKDAFKR
jgi:uncharacterized protein YjbJ (UPF0337 family)